MVRCGHYAGCPETQPRKSLIAFRLILLCQQICLILSLWQFIVEVFVFIAKTVKLLPYLLNSLKGGGIFK